MVAAILQFHGQAVELMMILDVRSDLRMKSFHQLHNIDLFCIKMYLNSLRYIWNFVMKVKVCNHF